MKKLTSQIFMLFIMEQIFKNLENQITDDSSMNVIMDIFTIEEQTIIQLKREEERLEFRIFKNAKVTIAFLNSLHPKINFELSKVDFEDSHKFWNELFEAAISSFINEDWFDFMSWFTYEVEMILDLS
ncbi:hypothetical protein ABID29_002269 [Streptococcus rupicaprae]|uniref:Uncharacterized protein n=1 Tax=Streptococcus rupicaprae TaxID=759619 RepID=A0ABV2FKM3_9STRE